MDYGYQLLRHVVQQVFGNLGAAARLTLAPMAIGAAILATLFFGMIAPLTGSREEIGTVVLSVLIGFLIWLVIYAWAAVSWHRFVLLEEYPRGLIPPFDGANMRRYMAALLRLGLALLLIIIVVGFAFTIVIAPIMAAGGGAIALLFAAGANIALQWVVIRFGLIFPAAALGQGMSLAQSWTATKPVSSAILLPIIVIPITFVILNAIVGLLPVVAVPFGIVLTWFQLLINLALLTTLYGNLIEGRRLN